MQEKSVASQKPPGRTLGSAGVHFGRAVLRGGVTGGAGQALLPLLGCYIQQHTWNWTYWVPACCRLCPAPFILLTAMTRTLLLAGRGEAYPLGSLEGKGYFCLNIKH